MSDEKPVDITEALKMSRADRAYREEMEKAGVDCDACTGLACGDECDGKSHATTEETNRPVEVMGPPFFQGCSHNLPSSACTSGPNGPSGYPRTSEPRPAAQDAEELKPCPLCGGQAKRISDNRIACKSCGLRTVSNQSYLKNKSLWNRRPSLPMSAEVEKAVETVREVVTLVAYEPTTASQRPATYLERRAVEACSDFDLIVAALKARG